MSLVNNEKQEDKKPTCTVEEIQTYRYPKATPRQSETKNPVEVPLKKDDHGMDGMRYAIHTHLHGNPGPGILLL